MILDPRATRFSNEWIRPLSDETAGLMPKPAAFCLAFNALGIGPLISPTITNDFLTRQTQLTDADYATVDATVLDDGRLTEGIGHLNAQDILHIYRGMLLLSQLLSADGAFVAAINRAAVNPRV